jgi:alpha-L-fucosidase 2
VDHPEFWYGRPASTWVEALPVGNGRLGAMIFGGIDTEHLQINDGTAWSGSLFSEKVEPVVTADAAKEAIGLARSAVARGDFTASDSQLRRLQHRYTQSYLPFADLHVTTGGSQTSASFDAADVKDYRRSLDLDSAAHQVSYMQGGYLIRRSIFVSAPDNVLVMTVETEDPSGLELQLDLTSKLVSSAVPHAIRPEGVAGLLLRMPSDISPPVDNDPNPVRYSTDDSASMHGAVALAWTHDGLAVDHASGSTLTAAGVHRAVIYLATQTTFISLGRAPIGGPEDAFAKASGIVAEAQRRGHDELRQRQRDDHSRLYSRVSFALAPRASQDEVSHNLTPPSSLPIDERLRIGNACERGVLAKDPGLAALMFNFGRYLLISSSRPGGVPANLQGIWNDILQAPWSGNYTTNINVEMNYWQSEVANLAELAEPLYDLIDVLADRGSETARRIYDAPGWVAHHNTDIWGYTQPVGRGQHEPRWAFWPLAGAWLLRHVWEHLLFGADDEFARTRAWRQARSSAEFFLAWLVEDDAGTLGTAPSTSPENNFRTPQGAVASSAASSTMDLALISDVFRMTVALAERLGMPDDPIAMRAVAALARIPGPPIGADGAISEWQGDFEQVDLAHRHLSHLYFAFPGDLALTPELTSAVIQSLDSRGDDATGWSLAWKLALRARVRQPEKVSDLLALVFRDMEVDRGDWIGGLYPNLLVAHPPFQIDGNFGFVAAISECLMQSHAGAVEILPALPAELATGRVTGLVARPGIEIDIEWTNGDLISVSLRPRTQAARRAHTVTYRDTHAIVDLTDVDESGRVVTISDFSYA